MLMSEASFDDDVLSLFNHLISNGHKRNHNHPPNHEGRLFFHEFPIWLYVLIKGNV